MYNEIRDTVLEEKDFLAVHDFLYHPYGAQNAMGSIHVLCDGRKSIAYIHEKVDDMERRIKKEFGFSLLIHVDPIVAEEDVVWLSSIVKRTLACYHTEGSFHDIQFKKEQEKEILYFDLLLPYSVTEETAMKIQAEIRDAVKEEKGMDCAIELDRPMIET